MDRQELLKEIGNGTLSLPNNTIYGETKTDVIKFSNVDIGEEAITAFARSVVDFLKLHPQYLVDKEVL